MIIKHFSKCFAAGLVTIFPIAVAVFALTYLETLVSGSWLSGMPFYFPGLGLIAAFLLIYLLGALTTMLAGNWLWNKIDKALHAMPALGRFYQSVKQILGYGQNGDAVFRGVVLIEPSDRDGAELGLITNEIKDESGNSKLLIFVPSAPNPTSGKLVLISPEHVKPTTITVPDALKSLVTIGKTTPGVTPTSHPGGE